MTETVIKIENLVKYFGGRCVLDNVSFSVPRGSIFGLLGRNGIGKTTLIRILLGLEPPTRGATFIFGSQSGKLTNAEKARIGYVAEGHQLIQNYKVSRLVSLCKGLSPKWNGKIFEELTGMFDLPMGKKVRELSTGMRAQLNLSLAMAVEPELLILDDPTLGLDTVARRQFLELAIEVIQRQGRTILFSSHILTDVERIADRIGILRRNKLSVDCSLEVLKQKIRKVRLIFPGEAPDTLEMTGIIKLERHQRELLVTVAQWNPQKRRIIESYEPENIIDVPMSLEDIFIECTDENNNGKKGGTNADTD